MSKETVTFSANEIEKAYSDADFSRPASEPVLDTWFEFEVKNALVQSAKGGYLQLSLMVSALNSAGETMFTKFVNAPLPVRYKGISPPEGSAGILASTLKSLLPEASPFDSVKKNPADESKRDYFKDGVKLDKKAFAAGEKTQTAAIRTVIDSIVDPAGSADALTGLVGRRFFAKLSTDKTGKYVNVKPMVGILGEGEVVCMDTRQAYGRI